MDRLHRALGRGDPLPQQMASEAFGTQLPSIDLWRKLREFDPDLVWVKMSLVLTPLPA